MAKENSCDDVLYSPEQRRIKEMTKVGEDLLKTLSNGDHNDVKIILEDGEIGANKCILAARSEYFARMFNNQHPFNEANGTVKIPTTKVVMEYILGYIYGGELDCIYDLPIDDNLKLLDILRLMLFHSAFEALYYVTLYKVLATFGRDDVDPKEYYLALDMAISLNLPKVEQELLVCLHVIINLSLNPDIVENITYEVFQKKPSIL